MHCMQVLPEIKPLEIPLADTFNSVSANILFGKILSFIQLIPELSPKLIRISFLPSNHQNQQFIDNMNSSVYLIAQI